MTSPFSIRRSSLWIASTASIVVALIGVTPTASALSLAGTGHGPVITRERTDARNAVRTAEQRPRGGGPGRDMAPGNGGPRRGSRPVEPGGVGPNAGAPPQATPPPTRDGGRVRGDAPTGPVQGRGPRR